MHSQYTAYSLFLFLGAVINLHARFYDAAVHSIIRKLSHKRVYHNLKGKPSRRFGVGRMSDILFAPFVLPPYALHINGRGKQVYYGVQKSLYALVLIRRSA